MNFAFANRTRETAVSLSVTESAAFDGLRSQAERQLATKLAEELAAGPASVRLRAAARLVDVAGTLALPALVAILDEPGKLAGAKRVELVLLLGRTSSIQSQSQSRAGERASIAAAYEVARRLQGDRDALVRAAAVEAAVRLGSNDAAAMRGALLEALDDADPRVRRRAALCAASTRGLDPGELLLPLVEDPDRQCRRLAVVALGSTTAPEAADALLLALLDDDGAVRAAAEASAQRLFGDDATGLGVMPALQRGRAVARLRAQLAANLARGRLVSDQRRQRAAPREAESRDVHSAVAELVANSVLDQLLADDEQGAAAPWMAGRRPSGEVEIHGDAGFEKALAPDDLDFVAADLRDEDIGMGPSLRDYANLVDLADAWSDADVRADSDLRDGTELLDGADAWRGADLLDGVDAWRGADLLDGVDTGRGADFLDAADAEGGDDLVDAADAGGGDDLVDAADAGGDDDLVDAADGPSSGGSELGFREIEAILRAALRGVDDATLAAELGFSPLALGPVLEEHLESGRIIRRGKKLFLP